MIRGRMVFGPVAHRPAGNPASGHEGVNGNKRKDFADVTLSFSQMTWNGANEPISAVRTSVHTARRVGPGTHGRA